MSVEVARVGISATAASFITEIYLGGSVDNCSVFHNTKHAGPVVSPELVVAVLVSPMVWTPGEPSRTMTASLYECRKKQHSNK